MTREKIIEACAHAICALYCPYELNDQDAGEFELYAETVHLLETAPRELLEWLTN